MEYEKIVVMGTGKIAISCLEILLKKGVAASALSAVEYGANSFSLSQIQKLCDRHVTQYHSCSKKADVKQYLQSIFSTALVVSVNNMYIFPVGICAKENIDIVNCHSALLPKYPGINARTWTIFNDEKIGGITWHYVDAGIDSGDIIAQSTMELPDDVTALKLMQKYMEIAKEKFDEIIEDVLNKRANRTPQQNTPDRKIYMKDDLPNNGFINAHDDLSFSYRVLRSMDYGYSMLMPHVKIEYNNALYEILSYKMDVSEANERKATFDENSGNLSISGNGSILRLKLNPIVDKKVD